MKKFIGLILILSLFIFTGCGKKPVKTSLDKIIDRDLLIVGINYNSKPFGYKSNITGKIEGFDADLARYIAKDIIGNERKIEFVEVTPNTRIESVTSSKVDMVIATMTATPQRQFLVDFSQPYYVAGQTALVKEDSDIYSFSDLRKKTIIIVLGTTAEKNIRTIIPNAKVIGYKDYASAFKAFKDGKADAISTDDTILTGFLMDNNQGYRILKNKISREPYAIAIKQQDDKKLKNALDVIITRMKKDGTIASLKKKWHLH